MTGEEKPQSNGQNGNNKPQGPLQKIIREGASTGMNRPEERQKPLDKEAKTGVQVEGAMDTNIAASDKEKILAMAYKMINETAGIGLDIRLQGLKILGEHGASSDTEKIIRSINLAKTVTTSSGGTNYVIVDDLLNSVVLALNKIKDRDFTCTMAELNAFISAHANETPEVSHSSSSKMDKYYYNAVVIGVLNGVHTEAAFDILCKCRKDSDYTDQIHGRVNEMLSDFFENPKPEQLDLLDRIYNWGTWDIKKYVSSIIAKIAGVA
ncbi:MAG: hypothetical protein NT051_02850 [Candidatus Micrarchaeota archaeon]|nr:hypothetical protein [Candidatus Micrarchaeota archaeon]